MKRNRKETSKNKLFIRGSNEQNKKKRYDFYAIPLCRYA